MPPFFCYMRYVMTVIDLFAGCGGMSLGFEKAGFNVVAAYEWWDAAVRCYAANFRHSVYQRDLSAVDEIVPELREFDPDVIIGGPPCQEFSQAGRRVEGDRAELTECFARIISGVKPKCFVMENVDRAIHSRSYARAREIYKSAGYGLTEVVLDASLCGVPQKRKRFICFGMLGAEDGFAATSFQYRMSEKPMTLRDYFGDQLKFQYYYRHPRNYNRRAVFSIDEPAPTMRGVNRPVPKGYRGSKNDSCPVSPDLHVLTMKERAMIQTFPEDYQWIGNKTEIEQMIGNAVPVGLAHFIGIVVREFMEEKDV